MKRILIILYLILTCEITIAQVPDSWARIADCGDSIRSGAIAFSIGSFGYVGLGLRWSGSTNPPYHYYTDLWQYNPNSNVWTQKSNFPGVPRFGGVCFVIGSKMYMGLGQNETSNGLEDFWEYDPTNDAWVQKANFGGGNRSTPIGFSIGSKGYVGLGSSDTSNFMKDIWEYNPATDVWTQKANFGGIQRSGGVAFSIYDKGYVGLGYSPGSVYNLRDWWQYDTTDTWIQKSDFAGFSRGASFCFVINENGYIGTGADSINVYCSDFWKYNSVLDQWELKDSFGGGNRSYAAGFAIGNKGYAGSGDTINIAHPTKDFWVYTPDSISTGISGVDAESLYIYPNPTSDKLYIKGKPLNASVSICDMTGRALLISTTKDEIDISAFPSGMYIVEIKTNEVNKTIKFTKL